MRLFAILSHWRSTHCHSVHMHTSPLFFSAFDADLVVFFDQGFPLFNYDWVVFKRSLFSGDDDVGYLA